jgi:hypothetical protein
VLRVFQRKTERSSKSGRSLPVGFVVVKGRGEHLMSYRTAVELGIAITIDDDRTVNRVGKPADTKPSLQGWSWTLAVDRSGATRFQRSQRCHRDVMRGGLLIRKDWGGGRPRRYQTRRPCLRSRVWLCARGPPSTSSSDIVLQDRRGQSCSDAYLQILQVEASN